MRDIIVWIWDRSCGQGVGLNIRGRVPMPAYDAGSEIVVGDPIESDPGECEGLLTGGSCDCRMDLRNGLVSCLFIFYFSCRFKSSVMSMIKYACINKYLHTHICTYICVCIIILCVCMCMCVCVYVRVYVCVQHNSRIKAHFCQWFLSL